MKNLYDISDWNDVQEHQMLGEILLQADKINLIHLGMALDIQRFESIPLGEVFLNMRVITSKDLEAALSLQAEIDALLEVRSNNEF